MLNIYFLQFKLYKDSCKIDIKIIYNIFNRINLISEAKFLDNLIIGYSSI